MAVVVLSVVVVAVCMYCVRRYNRENQIVTINLGTKVHPKYWKMTHQRLEEISAETTAQVQQETAKIMSQRRQ
jgi:hypothetical protein